LDHVISSNKERRSELTLSKPFPYTDGRYKNKNNKNCCHLLRLIDL
jgi:hypothetical protein